MLQDINELTPVEELALIGLLKAVIQADLQLTSEENRHLDQLAEKMGRERFDLRVSEARQRFITLSDIKHHAEQIERQDARQFIFNLVSEMAKQDDLLTEEEDLLSWLAELWGLEYFRN
jgi:hypothetical protein